MTLSRRRRHRGGDPIGPGATTFNVTHFARDTQGWFDPARPRRPGHPEKSIRKHQHAELHDARRGGSPRRPTSCRPATPRRCSVLPARRHPRRRDPAATDDERRWRKRLCQLGYGVGRRSMPSWCPAFRCPCTVRCASVVLAGNRRPRRCSSSPAEPFNIEPGVPRRSSRRSLRRRHALLRRSYRRPGNVADHAVNDHDNSLSVALYQFQALLAAPPTPAQER